MNIIESLYEEKVVDKDLYVICNGYKKQQYIDNIAGLINSGWENTISILDNMPEIEALDKAVNNTCKIGIRIAAEEEPKFEFYTSRLGIRYSDVVPYYHKYIKRNSKFKLKMLHFFINTGIQDNAYYWNELSKCVNVYCDLKNFCPEFGFLEPWRRLSPYVTPCHLINDYEYMTEEIIAQIKKASATAAESKNRTFLRNLARLRLVKAE